MKELLEAIGGYGVQCSETKELAPPQYLLDAIEELDSAINLLCLMYSAWEEGQPCYEDYDEEIDDGTFIGNAFRLSESDEQKIIDILNKYRPRTQPTMPNKGE